MVRVEGLEPPRLAAPEPKSGASTNFATPAVDRKQSLVSLTKEKPSYETQNDLFIILDTLGLLKIAYQAFIFDYFLINLINF